MRFVLRHDTAEEWEKHEDFIPLRGEPIVVFDQFGDARIKIGDGVRNYGELKFVGGDDWMSQFAVPAGYPDEEPSDRPDITIDDYEFMQMLHGG